MSKLSNAATYCVRKLWTLIAITLVVLALLVSLLRYSLPLLDEKKHFFEDYALEEYGVALNIASFSASWQGAGPALVLHGVTLAQSDKSPIELNIDNIYVEIDFWDSLLTRQISSKIFSLDGLLLDVDLQQIERADSDFPILDALESLFLEQLQSFSLVNSEVTISGENNQQSFDIENLSWINKADRHQGSGLVSVSELTTNSAFFVIDLVGSADNFDGTIYARAEELDLSPWVNEFSALESDLLGGRANFEFWAEIEQKSISKVFGNVKPTRFIWQQDEVELSTAIESGSFVAQPTDNKWLFNVNDLVLSVYEKTVKTNWRGFLSKQGEFQVQSASSFSVAPLLPMAGLFNNQLSKQLKTIAAQGNVANLAFQSRPAGNAVQIKLTDIAWQANTTLPDVSGLNTDISWQKNIGAIRIYGDNIEIDDRHIFPQGLSVEAIDLPIQFYQTEDAWLLSSTSGNITLPETDIQPSFEYHLDSGLLSLSANVDGFAVSHVKKYLPKAPYLGKGLSDFLNKALYADGEITNAQVLWHGKPSQFPFKNNEGIFQANVAIENADFLFQQSWPSVNNLDIDLHFENLSLSMQSESAQIADVDADNIKAYIPLLTSGADLVIEANATGNGYAVSQLLAQSSLSDGLGKLLSRDILVSNELTTQLSLYVPLDDPASTSASGIVTLPDNFVQLPKLLLELENVQGKITFDNDKVAFKGLRANLLGQAITAEFSGANHVGEYRFDVDLSGDWELAPLIPLISSELQEYVTGSGKWNSSIQVALAQEDFSYSANLFTKLEDVSSILPAPFDKRKDDNKVIKLEANGGLQASNIKLTFGDKVDFDGILPHKELQFSRAHLAIGDTDFVGRGVGFSISASLPEIHAAKWYQGISALVSGMRSVSANPDRQAIFAVPQRIFIETDHLIFAGQALNDVNATVKTIDKDWVVDIASDEANAQVTFYDRWLEDGIEIDADYVRFDNWIEQEDQQRPKIEPQSLPRIRVNCKDCQVLGYRLGEVKFESFPNDDGLRIDNVQINSPNGALQANGQWYKRNGDHYTFINGELNSRDFGAFLDDFQFDSGIKDSEASVDLALTWKESPFDFSFENLDGELQWELSDGYITQLSDKGSRIFTLLSLDSLVRKLSLDFRDVFAKGFFYDKMRGSVQVTEGKADTRDTKIDGGAGELEIYGYTDLVSKELNYNVSFTPNVTGNLPVLVYFMVNPPTALAALALDQMLTSAKVISNINYSVTGTLAEPILIETGRENTEVDLPARREQQPPETDVGFVPPTEEDRLMMEVNSG